MTRLRAALPVLATLGALLAGCGDDGDSPSASAPAPKADTKTAEGTGYTVEAPKAFRDVTSNFDGSAFRIDLAVADPEAKGFATNFIVVRETGGEVKLDEVMKVFTKQAEAQATDEGISEIEDREIDGVPAKTYAFDRPATKDGPVRQRQVVAVKDDAVYTITWSVSEDDFEAQEATLDQMLESWRWS